jgi:hypothetical protein
MGFFNNLSNWFHNTIIAATYNPAADALTNSYNNSVTSQLGNLQSTVSHIGGGLGAAVMSIPGVGKPIMNSLSALQAESKKLLASAKTMTPSQIAAENDKLIAKANELQAEATKAGLSVSDYQDKLDLAANKPLPFTIKRFFTSIFSSTLYICLFILVLFLALLGSSLAANSAMNKPVAYRIYYMVYGFLLFPLSIILGIYNYMNHKKLFYAIWAPLHTSFSHNKFLNVLLFPFIYTPIGEITHFAKTSLVHSGTTHKVHAPLVRDERKFDPSAV